MWWKLLSMLFRFDPMKSSSNVKPQCYRVELAEKKCPITETKAKKQWSCASANFTHFILPHIQHIPVQHLLPLPFDIGSPLGLKQHLDTPRLWPSHQLHTDSSQSKPPLPLVVLISPERWGRRARKGFQTKWGKEVGDGPVILQGGL